MTLWGRYAGVGDWPRWCPATHYEDKVERVWAALIGLHVTDPGVNWLIEHGGPGSPADATATEKP